MHLNALATLTGIAQDEACDDGIFIREAVPLRQCLLVAPLPPTLDSPALRRSKLRWPQIQQEPNHERPLKVSLYGDSSANLLRPFINAKSITKPELGADFSALI